MHQNWWVSCLTESPTIVGELEKSVRRVCGKLLRQGYEAVLDAAEFELDWDEDEFTRELVKHMNNINETEFPIPISIHWDEKGKSQKNLDVSTHPSRAQRVDITLDYVRSDGTTEYWLEAKRVSNSDTALYRKYWKEGVRRFIDGEYADKFSFAGMIAYVLSGGIDKNVSELEDRCSAYKSRMLLKQGWEYSHSEGEIEVYRTHHCRDELSDIVLDHHLLNFTES